MSLQKQLPVVFMLSPGYELPINYRQINSNVSVDAEIGIAFIELCLELAHLDVEVFSHRDENGYQDGISDKERDNIGSPAQT
jgi:hypothetical protein